MGGIIMNNKMRIGLKKYISLALLGAFMVGMLYGCGSSDSSGSAKVLYIITDNDDTFRAKLSDAIVSQADSQGVDLTVVESGSSVEDQLDLVESAASDGYTAIILRLADSSTALQMNVASNGLPIVYVNSEPSEEHLTSNEFIFVGSNEEEAGQYQAEYVIDKLGTKAMNIIIFEGEPGHSGTIGRTKAVKYTLKDNNIDYNIVFMDYANWSDTEACDKLNLFMKTGQTFDAVFCNNDTMALGVIESMKQNGLDYSAIPVCGVDATSDGCTSILAGEMAFTVLQNAESQAARAVEAAAALGTGGSITDIEGASDDGLYIWVPFEPVDASNAAQYQ